MTKPISWFWEDWVTTITETPRQESIKLIANWLHIFFFLKQTTKSCKSLIRLGSEWQRQLHISEKVAEKKGTQELCVFGCSQKVRRRFLPVSRTRTRRSCFVKCNTYSVLMTVNDFLYQPLPFQLTHPAAAPSLLSLPSVAVLSWGREPAVKMAG